MFNRILQPLLKGFRRIQNDEYIIRFCMLVIHAHLAYRPRLTLIVAAMLLEMFDEIAAFCESSATEVADGLSQATWRPAVKPGLIGPTQSSQHVAELTRYMTFVI